MADDLASSTSIVIDAPVDRVWEALTTPERIKEWFFGVDTISDWRPGGSLVHRGEYRGKPYEDKGTIEAIDPPRRLIHSHWSPVSGLPDRPEHYQRVVWDLVPRGAGTELTVSETNLPSPEAKETSDGAWSMALGNLKRVLEGSPASR
jgi:uncharacterized protein YndB with AHSA1/START domain